MNKCKDMILLYLLSSMLGFSLFFILIYTSFEGGVQDKLDDEAYINYQCAIPASDLDDHGMLAISAAILAVFPTTAALVLSCIFSYLNLSF